VFEVGCIPGALKEIFGAQHHQSRVVHSTSVCGQLLLQPMAEDEPGFPFLSCTHM